MESEKSKKKAIIEVTYGESKNQSEWYGFRVNNPFPVCMRPWAIHTCKNDQRKQKNTTKLVRKFKEAGVY